MMQSTEKLRILMVSGRIALDSPSVYAVDLATEFIRKGCAVKFVCAGAVSDDLLAPLRSPSEREGNPLENSVVVRMPGLTTPVFSWFKRSELKRGLRSFQPDIVHSTSEQTANASASLAKALGIPCVVTCHNYQSSPPFRLGGISSVISVSEALREFLVNKLSMPKDIFTVIPNGINLRYYEASTIIPSDRKQLLVGTFGRMIEQKGHSYFLKAASRVLSTSRDIHFLLAGDGPMEKQLRKLTSELGIRDKVTFSNYPFRAHSVIREMDIFVLPSLQESLGFAALEALAYAKPVVCFGVGGVYTFIKDGETGLIVPVRNVEQMTDAIIRLADDEQLRQRLGMTGRRLVEEQFAISKISDRILELYKRVMKG